MQKDYCKTEHKYVVDTESHTVWAVTLRQMKKKRKREETVYMRYGVRKVYEGEIGENQMEQAKNIVVVDGEWRIKIHGDHGSWILFCLCGTGCWLQRERKTEEGLRS